MLSQNSKVKSQNYSSKGKSELKERCYHYSIKTIKFIDSLPEKRINWVISNQLLRSATSIGANVIEAKSASSRKDFIRFYEIALKSANETTYWLGLMQDALNIDGTDLKYLLKETDELTKMIAASLITLKNKNKL
ncbi:MAG: four helix bundle protein [Dehalococcoidales bacterium]|jgi:four helix bundle protein